MPLKTMKRPLHLSSLHLPPCILHIDAAASNLRIILAVDGRCASQAGFLFLRHRHSKSHSSTSACV